MSHHVGFQHNHGDHQALPLHILPFTGDESSLRDYQKA
jgi:hypothetical protein